MPNIIRGTGTAIVTPFTKSGDIDEKSLRNLVDWQVKNKVEFIVPCGSTGESITMSKSERRRVIEIVLDEVNGKIPVIPGTGSSSTADSIALTNDAKEAGAETVLLVSPAYNKPTQSGLFEHFRKIAEECDVKVVLYNVPGRTASNMLPETTLKLAEEVENIIAIKEASNILEQIMQIIKYRPENFAVLSGDDSLTLPIITAGGDGVISVISNEMPKEFSDMIRDALKGDIKKAQELHYQMFELMKINFIESNPTPVKTALNLMGMIEDTVRLPLVQMTNANKEKLRNVLKDLELIK